MDAEAILVSGVTEILKKLSSFMAKEIGLAWGVKDELQKLKKTLDMILAVLVDAEKKQVRSVAVRLWLEELKDIAYEADDILDEYSYELMHQCEMNRKRDKVRNFFSSSNPLAFRSKIAHEIKDIHQKFNEVAKRKENLGLQIVEIGTSRTTNPDESRKIRETDSIVDESLRIVGRDNDKSNIINKLLAKNPCNQDENIHVIPIVGMGGLGKTTLAQLIYNVDAMKNHFDLKMWVCVSNEFDVKKLYMKIIESITNTKCDHLLNIDVVARQLQRYLSGKKYLLVLDDVWNKKSEEWERFKKPLVVGGEGSKILVTTRSDKVASIVGGELHSYKLGILKENESWYLFQEKTFGSVGAEVMTPTLMAIGKELVKKCGGLPLAIIFLGSLLRSKKENEWSIINKNKIWDQSCDEDESRILPVLKLSYDNLPSHLKLCFSSFFPLYPKNCRIYKKNMIKLWMAEGFLLQPSNEDNISMEEVGNEYFNNLLYNSFFQDVEKDDIGQVRSFKMHDLVHDLAKYVAGDRECFVLAAHENMESIPRVRRLKLINFNEGMSKTVCKALHNKPELRTLLVVNGTIKKIENVFDGIKRLRVLVLSEVPNIEEIPSSLMGNLKHLRFLDLSYTKITNLPKSITRLYHLQTLDLFGCVNLKELPKGIEKLVNLRHLMLPDDINIPREIVQLSSLQTLYPFNVDNYNYTDRENSGSGGRGGGCGIDVLEGLNLLKGNITINHLRNVTSGIDAQRANLKGKKDLNKIFLSWHSYNSNAREDGDDDGEFGKNKDEIVLEALQPHPNLKLLVLDQYFGAKLPWWMMGDAASTPSYSCLPNLVHLELNHCTKCEQLVGFGKLPSLRVLKMWKMDGIKSLDNKFYGGGVGGGGDDESSSSCNSSEAAVATTKISVLFPSLKELGLSDMCSLEKWDDFPPPTSTVVYSCFPYLEQIWICGCPNLKITPTHFPSLKELNLQEIDERVVVPLITTNLNSLHSVKLVKISKLKFLPHCLLQGNNLRILRIVNCLDFQGFPPNEEGLQQRKQAQSSSTRVLSLILLPFLKFLPDIRSFTSLEKLYIKDCERFRPLPEELTCLSSSLEHLKLVEIQNVKEVEDFKWWR